MRSPVAGMAGLLALVLAVPAAAATDFSPLPDRALTASAAGSTTASCRTLAPAGSPGVWQRRLAAPGEGFASVRLDGPPAAGDWDLALFDAATGRPVDESLGFDANELTQAWMRSGGTVVAQACRRAGAARSVPATFSFGLTAWPKAAPPLRSVRIPLSDTRTQVPQLLALGADVDEHVTQDAAYATVSEDVLQKLTRAGFVAKVLQKDVLAADRRLLAGDAARARARAASDRTLRADAAPGLPSGRTTYRTYADYQADLKKLANDFPGLVRGFAMPEKTFQGREQLGVEISSAVDATDDQKPISMIMGIHHAREWPAGEMPMEFATYLAQQYGKDPRVTKLLDTTRVVVVPVVNPDGFVSSRSAFSPTDTLGDPLGAPGTVEGAGLGGQLAYRRKNCNGAIPVPSVPCDLQIGIDPNRNYGFGWGGKGASTTPTSQSYRGPSPFSEQETRSVHEFSQTHDITTLITTHNFASLVLRPPGVSGNGLAPDEDRLRQLGDAMAADTGYVSQYGYQLYDTSGTTEDWNYGAAGTYGYTIELGPTAEAGGNFHVAYQQGVIDQWNGTGARAGLGMRNAYLTAAEYATSTQDFAQLTGKAPPGRILRLHRTFTTMTDKVCAVSQPSDVDPIAIAAGGTGAPNPTDCIAPGAPIAIPDKLDYTTKVGPSATFSWIVTPSTRPFDYKAGRRTAWTLTCEDTSGKVYETRQLTIWRGEKAELVLPCGNPNAIPVTVTASGARDRSAPQSRFTTAKLRATRSGIFLNGTSKDVAPKGLTPRLKSVSVSIARTVGRSCRFATRAGTFGKAVPCTATPYLAAKGTSSWSFVFNHPVPKGRYFAWVRARDVAGNTERKSRTRNLITFTVR